MTDVFCVSVWSPVCSVALACPPLSPEGGVRAVGEERKGAVCSFVLPPPGRRPSVQSRQWSYLSVTFVSALVMNQTGGRP